MGERLSEMEYAILLMVGILGEEAYPTKISEEFFIKTSRVVSVGAIHSILTHLETRGYVHSVIIKYERKRINRSKRIYTVTDFGRHTNKLPYLIETMEALLCLYHAPEYKRIDTFAIESRN